MDAASPGPRVTFNIQDTVREILFVRDTQCQIIFSNYKITVVTVSKYEFIPTMKVPVVMGEVSLNYQTARHCLCASI